MDISAFEFAAGTSKEIIAFSTAALVATATFAKDTFLSRRTSIPVALGLSWIFYLLSILGGVWTLGALTGELSEDVTDPSIFSSGVVLPAVMMFIAFVFGAFATALAGWQAVRQIVKAQNEAGDVSTAKLETGRP